MFDFLAKAGSAANCLIPSRRGYLRDSFHQRPRRYPQVNTIPYCSLAFAMLACAPLAWAEPTQDCEVILCGSGCYVGRYLPHHLEDVGCDSPTGGAPGADSGSGSGSGYGWGSGQVERVFSNAMAPDPVKIECEPMGGGDFLCEGYPTGDDFSYSWSTTGPISLPYPGTPADNYQWVSCNAQGNAVLTMTVISPSGTVGSRNKAFSCSAY